MNLSTYYRNGIGGDKTSHWGGGMVAHRQGEYGLVQRGDAGGNLWLADSGNNVVRFA